MAGSSGGHYLRFGIRVRHSSGALPVPLAHLDTPARRYQNPVAKSFTIEWEAFYSAPRGELGGWRPVVIRQEGVGMTGLLTFPIENLPEGYELVAVIFTIFFSMGVMLVFGQLWGENE
jgi:hypothetical protein